jgi:HAD superfamily hydrolase (TIGR01662 family)
MPFQPIRVDSKKPAAPVEWPSTNGPKTLPVTGGRPISSSNKALMKGLAGEPDRFSGGRPIQAKQADALPGGMADKVTETFSKWLASEEGQQALAQGQQEEREHTDSPEIAAEIATDHLVEDKTYYSKLEQMVANAKHAASKIRSRAEVVVYGRDGILGIKKDGYLLMPGGGLDDGETPEIGAYREAIEEADRKLLHLEPCGYAEATWPAGKPLVPGFTGERTYQFTALDGGKLGTTHEDNEAFEMISFDDAEAFIKACMQREDQAWAKDVNELRLKAITRVRDAELTPAKLAAWVFGRVKLSTAPGGPTGSPSTEARILTTLKQDADPDDVGNHPAVLVDLDHTIRGWNGEGMYRQTGAQHILPNRLETLNPLKALGVKIIGVTNHTLHQKANHAGLTPEILAAIQHETIGLTNGALDDVVYASHPDDTLLKPAPTMLQHAFKRFGLDPKRTVMVGDNVDHDGGAATAAGVPFHEAEGFFADSAATVAAVTKQLALGQKKTADTPVFADRSEYVMFNQAGQVMVAPDANRRYRLPTTGAGKPAPYEPALRYLPPDGAPEPGIHGYNMRFNVGEADQPVDGYSWADPTQVLKDSYASMGLKANAPYRELDRARVRVLLRALKKRQANVAQPL